MKKIFYGFIVLFFTAGMIRGQAAAQDTTPEPADRARATEMAGKKNYANNSDSASELAKEVEALRGRVEALEQQNRAMAELLIEVRSRLAGTDKEQAPEVRPAAAAFPREPLRTGASLPTAASSNNPQPAGQTAVSAAPQAKQDSNNEPVRWSEIIGNGNKIKLYGFLRLDMDIDSQRPNNAQTPLFITSADPRTSKPDAGNSSIHPRLTRLGIDYTGPRIATLGDGKIGGKLELDFENGGSESRQIIRIRHAYFKMDWGQFSILGGQTWDIYSPLFPTVNNDTLRWYAGNVGDRRPQFRASWEPKAGKGQWSFTGGIGLTGAIDAQDLDANGFRDGEESGRPDVQARVGYSRQLWVSDQRASLGASGFYGWMNTSRPAAGRTSFRNQLVNIDYTLPLAARAELRGEGWWGRNMSDLRGGAGQGINPANGREIRGRGGWSELRLKLSRYWTVHPGFTTDDPVDEDLPAGARTRNRAFYFGNRITPGGNFQIGFDYLRWRTDYKGSLSGIDNRVNLFFQYSF